MLSASFTLHRDRVNLQYLFNSSDIPPTCIVLVIQCTLFIMHRLVARVSVPGVMESRPRLAIGDVVRLRPPALKHTLNESSTNIVTNTNNDTISDGSVADSHDPSAGASGGGMRAGQAGWNVARHGVPVAGEPAFEVKVWSLMLRIWWVERQTQGGNGVMCGQGVGEASLCLGGIVHVGRISS